MNQLARDEKQIGSIIRRRRKHLKLSQSQLGEKSGVRQALVSIVESGNPATKIKTILSILSALDLEFQIQERSNADRLSIEDIF